MYYLEAEGLTDDIGRYFIKKLQKRPKNIENLLINYGNNKIIRLDICRKPIKMGIYKLLNYLTGGNVEIKKKELNYDNIYHLFMIIYLDNGIKIGIEKNERVNIWYNVIENYKNTECRLTNVINRPTLKEFIENGEKKGGKNFYRYSGHLNNCQKFINDLVTSNGIYKLTKFILQNVSEILTPKIKKISLAITDIAGIFNYIIHGGYL